MATSALICRTPSSDALAPRNATDGRQERRVKGAKRRRAILDPARRARQAGQGGGASGSGPGSLVKIVVRRTGIF